jgi:hypothetical protein
MQVLPHGLPFLQVLAAVAGADAAAGACTGADAAAGACAGAVVAGADAAAGACAGAETGAAGGGATGGAVLGEAAFVAAVAVPPSLWQTSFCAMQLLPQGFPFLQFFASAKFCENRTSAPTRRADFKLFKATDFIMAP